MGGGEWRAKLASGTLDRDNLDPAVLDPNNTVARLATQYRAVEFAWQGEAKSWGRLGVQLGAQRLQPVGSSTRTQGYGFVSWERGL